MSAAHARHLHVAAPEDLYADAERHVARRRNRQELDGVLDVLLAAGFVALIVFNLYAWIVGIIHILASTFGG